MRCFLLATGLAVAAPVAAQTAPDSTEQLRIKGVIYETSDVYPPGQDKGFIAKSLNWLHFTTRPGVLRQELLLEPGEIYDSSRVAETERALRSLRIFRWVAVDSVRADSGLMLRVRTQDAFTTRVEGSIAGSTRSNVWWVALNELNLLGTATRVGIRYRRETDRDAVTTSFSRNRLIDRRIGVTTFWDRRSDGRMLYGSVALPFFSFASPSSWYLTGEERSERILRYFEGEERAGQVLQRRFWMARAGAGVSLSNSATGYLRAGLEGQLRRDDYADTAAVDTLRRSVSGAVTAYVQWRAAQFLVSDDFQGIGRQEDIDLSTVVHASLGFTPKGFGYPDNGVVPGITALTGYGWRRGFARVSASALGRITEAGVVDSGSVHLGATVVLRPRLRHMAVLHGTRGWQKNPMPGGEFDLGVGVGPRGFDAHAFTGTEGFLLAAEYRYTVADNFLNTAGLGIAGFADYGGAWYPGSPKRTGYSIGAGLRFGLTFASDLSPARLDFAYINGSGLDKGAWRLVFGKGFVFNLSGRLDR